MKKKKLCIIVTLLIFLIIAGNSTSVAEYIDNANKEKGDKDGLGYVFMVGRISLIEFVGGYGGSYEFYIECVFTFGNQKPRLQLIENRVAYAVAVSVTGWIGNFFIFAEGDFELIN